MEHRHSFSLLEIVIACSIAGTIALSMTIAWLYTREEREFRQACTSVEHAIDRCWYLARATGQEVSLEFSIKEDGLTIGITAWFDTPTLPRPQVWRLHALASTPNYSRALHRLLLSHRNVATIQSYSTNVPTAPKLYFFHYSGLIGTLEQEEPFIILRRNQFSHTIHLNKYRAPITFISIPAMELQA